MTNKTGGSSHRDLADAIQSAWWTRLLRVCQRLGLSIQVIDTRLTPVAPGRDPSLGRNAESLLGTLEDPAMQALLLGSINARDPEVVALERTDIACSPISGPEAAPAGAVLLASDSVMRGPDRSAQRQLLTRAASWIAAAIETCLAGPGASAAAEVDRLTSLFRMLDRASASGSEDDVVRAFIESLAVWQDAESWAYLGDLDGRFELTISLAGSDRSRAPATIEAAAICRDGSVSRLTPEAAERAGFREAVPAIAGRVQGAAGAEWVIVVCGSAEGAVEQRLAVYSLVLAEALNALTTVSSSRLTWAMLQHLWPASDDRSLEDAARGAVNELQRAVGGGACLAVEAASGAEILAIGVETSVPMPGSPSRKSEQLTAVVGIAGSYRAAIGIRRSLQRALTGREATLLESAAGTFAAWLNAIVARLSLTAECRVPSYSFDQVVEQHVCDAAAGERDVSMIVVSLGRREQLADASHSWIGAIKRQIRPTDLAGRLSSGNIGILLPGTSGDLAQVVADRVRHIIASEVAFHALALPAIGLAYRRRGAAARESLIAEAQTRAMIHSRVMESADA